MNIIEKLLVGFFSFMVYVVPPALLIIGILFVFYVYLGADVKEYMSEIKEDNKDSIGGTNDSTK